MGTVPGVAPVTSGVGAGTAETDGTEAEGAAGAARDAATAAANA